MHYMISPTQVSISHKGFKWSLEPGEYAKTLNVVPKIELRVADHRHTFAFLTGISLQKTDIF